MAQAEPVFTPDERRMIIAGLMQSVASARRAATKAHTDGRTAVAEVLMTESKLIENLVNKIQNLKLL